MFQLSRNTTSAAISTILLRSLADGSDSHPCWHEPPTNSRHRAVWVHARYRTSPRYVHARRPIRLTGTARRTVRLVVKHAPLDRIITYSVWQERTSKW